LVAHARGHGDPKIEFLEVTDDHRRHGFDHYFNLLAYRKIRGEELHADLETRLGRPPAEGEFKAECQSQFGDRGQGLAYKGWTERTKPNRFADEEMVVLAVLTALMRGVDAVIFTRDTDIEEQFLKLMLFLHHDYRAMFLADRYAANPRIFDFRRLDAPPGNAHVDDDHILVREVPMERIEALLPLGYRPLHLHSVTTSGNPGDQRVAPLTYCAESGIKRLLELKARTGGLNTDRVGGLNARLGTVPKTTVTIPTIVRERLVPVGTAMVPALDKEFATKVSEQVAPMFLIPPSW
jgi:hypothetical protein